MQVRAVKTKENILKTAVKVFAKRGFYGARIEELSKQAKVNKQRIYAYFGSKEGLFQQALLQVFGEIEVFAGEDIAVGGIKPEELTRRLLHEYFSMHEKHPYFWRMLVWANLELTVPPDSIINVNQRAFVYLRKVYLQGVKQGIFSGKVSFEIYIYNVIAATFFYHSNRRTLQKSFPADLFSDSGRERFITETIALFEHHK